MSRSTTDDLLEGLNPPQAEAVQHTEGPLLIVAGAGSGKTRVLTQRIAYLLAAKRVAPFCILAITFTNKAAKEMKERVSALVGPQAEDIWISTFHSMCVRILRREIDKLGYSRSFSIIDSADQLSAIKECMKQLNIDTKQFDPKTIRGSISTFKNELKDVKQAQQMNGNYYEQKATDVYAAYQKMLRANESLDFDDLIMLTVRLFEEHADVLDFYQRKFHYIHVDEYQDTNRAQYMLVQLLADKYQNLCVVGDSDQSVYGWRGADITNILSFEKDYPKAKVVKLEQNYRSTKSILEAANAVIQHNASRKEKNLWTENEDGQQVSYFRASHQHEEAYFVTETIVDKVHSGEPYDNFSVLYRTNAQSRVIEEVFVKSNIPYQIIGGTRFYDRKEIKDMLAYVRLVFNPHDDLSLRRVINVPKRGIGQTTVDKLSLYALDKGISLFTALGEVDFMGLSGRAVNKLYDFYQFLKHWNEQYEHETIRGLMENILEQSGYRQALELEKTIESRSRLENIDELLTVAMEFEKNSEDGSLQTFLDELALVSDLDNLDDEETDRVVLMTLHSAKGLEFPYVFLVGMEEGIFPHSRALIEESEMEEERRLAYVGITRSEKQLFLTNARSRTIYGRTATNAQSRFIAEIPEHLIQTVHEEQGMNDRQGSLWNSSTGTARSITQTSSAKHPAYTKSGNPVKQGTGHEDWKAGDKVQHKKWGQGTVVSISGSKDDLELRIAFPSPTGVKKLLASFAPITKQK